MTQAILIQQSEICELASILAVMILFTFQNIFIFTVCTTTAMYTFLMCMQKPSMTSTLPDVQTEQSQRQLDGTIEIQNVSFSYPTRPEVKVHNIIIVLSPALYRHAARKMWHLQCR